MTGAFAGLSRGEEARSFGAVELAQPGRTLGEPLEPAIKDPPDPMAIAS